MFQFNRRQFVKSGIAMVAATSVPFVAEGVRRGRHTFIAGFGKADITPDRPVPTIYTPLGGPPISAILDPIHVRTSYFNNGNEQVVIVSCDLLALPTWFTEAVKNDLANFGIPQDHVAINCSHTHTAPQIIFLRGIESTDDAYNTFAKDRIVQSVKDAMADAEPATIGFGTIDAPLNVNRIEVGRLDQVNSLNFRSGKVDPGLSVIRIRRPESKTTGLIYNFAAHPLTVSTDVHVISADYPGYTSAMLEAEPEIKLAQFVQGCGGSMNPRIHGDKTVTTLFARKLADYVKQACAGIRMQSNPKLAMKTQAVHLPYGTIPSLQEVNAILEAEEQKPPSAQPPLNLLWARAAKLALQEGRNFKTADATFQGIRLGNIKIAALPGEVFAAIGLQIKQHLNGNVITMGYSNNGEVGYIPIAEQVPLGGYEVENAPRRYGLFPWSPDIENYYISQAVELLQSL